jgi:hypothetical protein
MFFVVLLVTAYMSRHTRVNRPHKRKNSGTKTLIYKCVYACFEIHRGKNVCFLTYVICLSRLIKKTKLTSCFLLDETFCFDWNFWKILLLFQITVSKLPRIEKINFALCMCFCVIALITSTHFSPFYSEPSTWVGKICYISDWIYTCSWPHKEITRPRNPIIYLFSNQQYP